MHRQRWRKAIVAAALTTACATADPGAPSAILGLSKPTQSGDAQTGEVAYPLALPVRVRLQRDGLPAAGVVVHWTVTDGGDGFASPVDALSDTDGIAATTWTLGHAPGGQSLAASAPGAGGALNFSATAVTPVITAPFVASGEGQSDTIGAHLPLPIRALVTVNGSPVAGRTVTWTPMDAGAAATPATSFTDSMGIATTQWTVGLHAGYPGTGTSFAGHLRATAAHAVAPWTLTANVLPGAADSISVAGGGGQTADTGALFPTALAVSVLDRAGNLVRGVPITWSIDSGDATFPFKMDTTQANGIAVAQLLAGAVPGPIHVSAAAPGLPGSPVRFVDTAGAPPHPIVIHWATPSGSWQTDTAGALLQDSIRMIAAYDSFGGPPVAGLMVIWTPQDSGASVSADTTFTDPLGLSAVAWRLGTHAGSQTVHVASPGAMNGLQGYLVFFATAVAGQTALLEEDTTWKVYPAGLYADTGVAFGRNPTVRATDQLGNPKSGIPVQWSITGGSATIAYAMDTTDASGRASVVVKAGSVEGPVTVTATSPGLVGSPVSISGLVVHHPQYFTIHVGGSYFSHTGVNAGVDTLTTGVSDLVTWQWDAGAGTHNITWDDVPPWPPSGDISSGSYGPIPVGPAGTYHYHCTIHGPAMAGVVIVQ